MSIRASISSRRYLRSRDLARPRQLSAVLRDAEAGVLDSRSYSRGRHVIELGNARGETRAAIKVAWSVEPPIHSLRGR